VRTINKLIIHYSKTRGGDVEFMYDIAVNSHKHKTTSYHYIICNGLPHGDWKAGMDGMIQEGRPVEMQGAHARGHNADSIGICLIGDFEKTKPTPAQMQSLSGLLIELCGKYNITPFGNILGHRDVNSTVCPGRYLYSLIGPLTIFLGAVMWHRGRGE